MLPNGLPLKKPEVPMPVLKKPEVPPGPALKKPEEVGLLVTLKKPGVGGILNSMTVWENRWMLGM
ncbi:hypothetical protein MYIN104542_30455 [Mycobacterium intermedium]